jgi:6-phosphogluconolactonase
MLNVLIATIAAVVLWQILQNRSTPTLITEMSNTRTVYIGTGSSYIYRLSLDTKTGKLTLESTTNVGDLSANSRPTYLSIHPNKKFLYTINGIAKFNGEENTGGLLAYSIDPSTHDLKLINTTISAGNGPCSIVVDKTGSIVLVANYHGGTFGIWKLGQDGSLSKNPSFIQQNKGFGGPVRNRQDKPHPHQFIQDPSNKFAYCCDLGLDKIFQFVLDAEKGIVVSNPHAEVVDTKPGAGPRHIAFHPTLDIAYVINELSNTVDTYVFDREKGTLTYQSTITTIPEGATGEGCTASEIAVSPDGKFAYASNRGDTDTLITYSVQDNGDLKWIGSIPSGGKYPRHFILDETGDLLIVTLQNSNEVKVFRRNQETGLLMQISSIEGLKEPMCAMLLPQ